MLCAAALNQRRTFRGTPSTVCTSAMKTGGVEEEEAPVPEGEEMLFDELFANTLSEGGDEQMKGVRAPRSEDRRRMAQVMQEMQPQQVEFRGNKEMGATTLIPGRAVQGDRPSVEVTGGCMFNMSEAYADAVQRSGSV